MRQQHDVLVHELGRCVPRSRDQRDRRRPVEREPHLRRLGVCRPWPLARDRQRRPGAVRAGSESGRALRVVRRRSDVHGGLERQRPELARRHRRGTGSARSDHRVCVRLRPGSVATVSEPRRLDVADRLPAGVRAAVRGRPRDRPHDDRCDRQEQQDPDLPAGRHREQQRAEQSHRRELLAHGQREPDGGGAARVAGHRLDDPAGSGQPVPRDVQRLAEADLAVDREPVLRDRQHVHGSVLVRRRGLHAGGPAGHGLRHRLVQLRRAAVQHEGRRLRERPLERPRGHLLADRR